MGPFRIGVLPGRGQGVVDAPRACVQALESGRPAWEALLSQTDTAVIAAHLVQLVRERGDGLSMDHRLVANLLRERFPRRSWPQVVLHVAVREGVAADLAAEAGMELPAMQYERLVQRMYERAGVALQAGAWAVRTWCEALDRAAPEELPGLADPKDASPVAAHALLRPRSQPRELLAHRRAVAALAFHPNGKTLASGGLDRALRLWTPSSGDERTRIYGAHRDWVRAIAYSPDGELLVSGGDEPRLRLWNGRTHVALPALKAPGGALSVDFTGDGRRLVVAGADRRVRVWDLDREQVAETLGPYEGELRTIAVEARGRWLAVATTAGIHVHMLVGKRERWQPKVTGDRLAVAAGPDQTLVVGDATGAVIWSVPRRKIVSELGGNPGGIHMAVMHANGKVLVTGGVDRMVRIWRVSDGKQCYQFDLEAEVTALALSRGGGLAMGFGDGTAQVCRLGRIRKDAV